MSNIININQPFINRLKELLATFRKNNRMPENSNAVFIDRKGFSAFFVVPNPPPKRWCIPVQNRINEVFSNAPLSDSPKFEQVEFIKCGFIEDLIEYREY